MQVRKHPLLAVILGFALCSFGAIHADAQQIPTENDPMDHQTKFDLAISQLSEYYPGEDQTEIIEEIYDIVDRNGIPREEVAEAALNQFNPEFSAPPDHSLSKSYGGNRPAQRALGPSDMYGDISVTSAWSMGINHGHVGVFETKQRVIEAPGLGMVPRRINANAVQVYKGAVLQHVLVSDGKCAKSVREAAKLLNRLYRKIWKWNREESHSLNCSQLVWLAYVKGAKIDIDSDPQDGKVMPFDIYHSGFTQTYKTLN